MVAAVMSLITPVLRNSLVSHLPRELGMLIMSLQAPFCMRGEFDIIGTELTVLSCVLHQSPLVCRLCDYSSQQMEMFYWLQKSLDRSVVY